MWIFSHGLEVYFLVKQTHDRILREEPNEQYLSFVYKRKCLFGNSLFS